MGSQQLHNAPGRSPGRSTLTVNGSGTVLPMLWKDDDAGHLSLNQLRADYRPERGLTLRRNRPACNRRSVVLHEPASSTALCACQHLATVCAEALRFLSTSANTHDGRFRLGIGQRSAKAPRPSADEHQRTWIAKRYCWDVPSAAGRS